MSHTVSESLIKTTYFPAETEAKNKALIYMFSTTFQFLLNKRNYSQESKIPEQFILKKIK
jgi:hypothetical protein